MLYQNRKFLGALCALLCCLLFHPLAHADKMGMTWKKQSHHDTLGVDRVGCSGCDAYQGDTSCSTKLPILCLKQDNSPDPGVPILPSEGTMPVDFYNGWAEGHIGLTLPVPGEALMGVEDANDICRFFVGSDYRIGEHHDGKRQSGGYGGWNWYAYGDVNDSSRFWAHVNGQPANCWGTGAGVDSNRSDADILALVSPDIRLVNISTRAVIQGGHEDVIAGFIIKGTGKQMVLIRALGEGLGLSPGVDARLTLTTLSGDLIATNEESGNWVPPSIWNEWSWASMPIILDNWQPPHVSDAALLLDLPAGLYTAIMSSSGANGIGLVEANAIPIKKIRTLPFYMILRYLNEAQPDIHNTLIEIKDKLKNDVISSASQKNTRNNTPFDNVISEALKLARPVLPVLDSLSCTDNKEAEEQSCPLGDEELFIVNTNQLILGQDFQDFLLQYTGYLENIEEISVIEASVPEFDGSSVVWYDSENSTQLETQQVVNIDLAASGQFKLSDGSSNPPVTINQIRVLPLPDTMSSPVSAVRKAPQNTSTVSIRIDDPPIIDNPGLIRYATFYVWWQ